MCPTPRGGRVSRARRCVGLPPPRRGSGRAGWLAARPAASRRPVPPPPCHPSGHAEPGGAGPGDGCRWSARPALPLARHGAAAAWPPGCGAGCAAASPACPLPRGHPSAPRVGGPRPLPAGPRRPAPLTATNAPAEAPLARRAAGSALVPLLASPGPGCFPWAPARACASSKGEAGEHRRFGGRPCQCSAALTAPSAHLHPSASGTKLGVFRDAVFFSASLRKGFPLPRLQGRSVTRRCPSTCSSAAAPAVCGRDFAGLLPCLAADLSCHIHQVRHQPWGASCKFFFQHLRKPPIFPRKIQFGALASGPFISASALQLSCWFDLNQLILQSNPLKLVIGLGITGVYVLITVHCTAVGETSSPASC